ncbi:HTH-type transcriptional repressor YvoA [Candidatus Izimaplasma bacterium HR1]|jgi:GntR family transcriptional regulator|uniref:GntR family transcriptional regulator n=1 Tax=Candidatus Izimoplasma sp. HR1 TaxID=1541959 RepID=UPI0004F86888|nr:HTH-type transcriptional repressor YvoA [Candidatus Izimaplasma bacterium HR1]
MNIKPAKPAYIQIKNDIIKKIRTGNWQENQKIPSELKLMETYNVGRGTIRDAMKLIIDEGYVYIKKGVGTFVTQNEVGVSLEPFVSLTYFIKMRGLKIESKLLEQKEFIVDKECAEETGLELGSKALLVTRLRILEGKPLAIEMFRFSSVALEIFADYDFTQPISHYMFDVKKIGVSKMNMDFVIKPADAKIAKVLKLKQNEKMIESSRTVFVAPDNDLYYYLTFYCAEKLSYIGTEKFI